MCRLLHVIQYKMYFVQQKDLISLFAAMVRLSFGFDLMKHEEGERAPERGRVSAIADEFSIKFAAFKSNAQDMQQILAFSK